MTISSLPLKRRPSTLRFVKWIVNSLLFKAYFTIKMMTFRQKKTCFLVKILTFSSKIIFTTNEASRYFFSLIKT
ncbi:unnamed protein product [Moneuplotes crassus]|uniref:Uncharacterized protein n=1 Tax=Euplotes crassus TaxID=5936 RepID=A0AAD1XNZ3_EUPCR|nr:unnamed protein product [Moneuplotes crassus]